MADGKSHQHVLAMGQSSKQVQGGRNEPDKKQMEATVGDWPRRGPFRVRSGPDCREPAKHDIMFPSPKLNFF